MIQSSHEAEFSRNTTAQAINSMYQSLNKRLGVYENYSNEERENLIDGLFSIHGISKGHFNVINTVERLIQNNLNHESIDENSNKNDKTTKGILKESEAPFDKIVGYRYLYRKLKDIYGKQEATRLSGLMYDYSIALSDSTNILIPYSYYGNTPIIVKINNTIKFTTLKQLFSNYSEFAHNIESNETDVIFTSEIYKKVKINRSMMNNSLENKPSNNKNNLNKDIVVKHNIKIWDTSNGWVDIEQIIRHVNKKRFITYQTEGGHFAVVTEDHPIYMNDNSEKLAIDLKIGDEVLIENDLPLNDLLLNNIIVDENLAYFLGFMLGDGNINGHEINQDYINIDITLPDQEQRFIKFDRAGGLLTIYQKDILNTKIFEISKRLFNDFEYFKYNSFSENRITFSSPELNTLLTVFFNNDFKEKSYNKKLPNNILEWDRKSLIALLSGLIDSDGSMAGSFNAEIRMTSANMINQIYEICRILNLQGIKKRAISNLFFGISFKLTEEFLEYCEKLNNKYLFLPEKEKETCFVYNGKYSNKSQENKIKKIFIFTEDDLSESSFGKDELKYVYDITTTSKRFYANGMVQHNCWAFDASILVTDGKPFKPLKSKPAKRVDSYISILNEVIHQMSNHLAGAIAIGTFFMDVARLMIINEKITLETLKSNNETRKYIENQFQRFVHGVNSLSRSGGQESPFTNVSIFDKAKLSKTLQEYAWYFELSHDNKAGLDYVIDYIMELQFIYMDFFSKGDPCLDGMPYRFPVSTINLAKGKNAANKWEIIDKDFVKTICTKDIYRYNIFASEGTKTASCCRLINDSELFELGAQANSFGAGGSISLGSHRVATINFIRLAIMAKTPAEFQLLLFNTIQDTKKILFAHKKMMYDFSATNVFIKHSWIRLDRMFSTIGIIGMAETDAILKAKFGGKDYVYDILTMLNAESNPSAETNKEFAGTCVFNIEQIPGESMAHRLPKADNLIFGTNFKIYSNQTVPLWNTEASIWDRIKLDGKYNALVSGGGIVHINTGELITSLQAEELINFAVECECEHFAITGTFCACSQGHTTIGNKDYCPVCGAEIESKIARVVGMFTPVEDWSFEKFEFDFKLRKEYKNGDFNKPGIVLGEMLPITPEPDDKTLSFYHARAGIMQPAFPLIVSDCVSEGGCKNIESTKTMH